MDAYERLTSTRRDGVPSHNVEALCGFQRWAESQPGCNYTALRSILNAARRTERRLSLPQLQRAYKLYCN